VRGVVVLGSGDGLNRVELLERLADDAQRLGEILLGDDERRSKADNVDMSGLRGGRRPELAIADGQKLSLRCLPLREDPCS